MYASEMFTKIFQIAYKLSTFMAISQNQKRKTVRDQLLFLSFSLYIPTQLDYYKFLLCKLIPIVPDSFLSFFGHFSQLKLVSFNHFKQFQAICFSLGLLHDWQ